MRSVRRQANERPTGQLDNSTVFRMNASESRLGTFTTSIQATAGAHAVFVVADAIGIESDLQDDNNALIRVFSVPGTASATATTSVSQTVSSANATGTNPQPHPSTTTSALSQSTTVLSRSNSNSSFQNALPTQLVLVSAVVLTAIGLTVMSFRRRKGQFLRSG
jgi:hypothetical protein